MGILTVWSGKLIIWNNYKFVLLVQKCNLFGYSVVWSQLVIPGYCPLIPAYCFLHSVSSLSISIPKFAL